MGKVEHVVDSLHQFRDPCCYYCLHDLGYSVKLFLDILNKSVTVTTKTTDSVVHHSCATRVLAYEGS